MLVSLALLAVVLAQVDLGQSLRQLARLESGLLLVAVAVTTVLVPLRPLRWQAIFPPAARPGFWVCFRALAVGNLTNNALPGRAGDLLRCLLVRREHAATAASLALATVGVEKVLDGLALLGVLALSFLVFRPPWWVGELGLLGGLAFGGAFLLLLAVRSRTEWVLGLLRRLSRAAQVPAFGERTAGFIRRFADGLGVVTSASRFFSLGLFTLVIWAGEAVLVWALAMALHVSLSLPAAALVSAVLGLGLAIPAAPGFVGTYEFFSVSALRLLGVPPESALALTLVMHGWALLNTTLVGLMGLAASGLRWSHLVGARIQERPTT